MLRRHIVAVLGSVILVGCSATAQRHSVALTPFGPEYGPAITFQIALGDLDGDGDLDAVFANQGATPSRVLLNDGTGQFTYTSQLLTPQGHGVALGDLDGDGDLDAVIACASVSGRTLPTRVYLNDGSGTFEATSQELGEAALSGNLVALADVDTDGDLDVLVSFLTPSREMTSRTYVNDGAGLFIESDARFPFGAAFMDLDGDGDVDAFSKETGRYLILRQTAPGVYQQTWVLEDAALLYSSLSCLALGDIDGDGDVDVFDTNGRGASRGPVYVLLNDGNASFERRLLALDVPGAAWPALADLDGDDRLDVAITCFGASDRVWLGDGTGDFADSGLRLGASLETKGLAVGDLDGDGDLDLFIPVYGMVGGPAVVWRNETP